MSGVGAPTSKSVGAQRQNIMAYLYVLESLDDGRYYVGSTINLTQRLRHHLGGHTPTTKRFGEIKLVFSQEYSTLKEARKIECRLKRLKRKDYLARIIADGYIKLKMNMGQ